MDWHGRGGAVARTSSATSSRQECVRGESAEEDYIPGRIERRASERKAWRGERDRTGCLEWADARGEELDIASIYGQQRLRGRAWETATSTGVGGRERRARSRRRLAGGSTAMAIFHSQGSCFVGMPAPPASLRVVGALATVPGAVHGGNPPRSPIRHVSLPSPRTASRSYIYPRAYPRHSDTPAFQTLHAAACLFRLFYAPLHRHRTCSCAIGSRPPSR